MKITDIKQNTLAWHQARMSMPTSSEFDKIITYGGGKSDQQIRYMYEIIFQRMYGVYAVPIAETEAMKRGKQLEPAAWERFQELHKHLVYPGIFCTNDDGTVGCSPDGYNAEWEGVEIKVPDAWRHMMYSLEGPQRDYKAQLQGLMYVAGFKCVHFFSYHPSMPCVAHVVKRDEKYIEKLDALMHDFLMGLESREKLVRALGNYQPITRGQATFSARRAKN